MYNSTFIVTFSFPDWLAHQNAVFDLDWVPGQDGLVTASGDQSVGLWDVETEERIATFRGHTSSIKTVRFLPGNSGLQVNASWHL